MASTPGELAEALLRAARLLRRSTQQQIGPLGLNPHQARALRVIDTHGPLRPSELAEHLGIAARSATDSVAGLLDQRLVDRIPDPADGRAHLLVISGSGRTVLAEVTRLRSQVAQAFFAELDEADAAQLSRLLVRLDRHSP